MFLKSIEIQGFKSFAHKTVLSFNRGMTGIVGPNGSGKSNVADAVRWVLGEQKVKQLRGTSMQDVIFAGTELRKPLGFAFVAMTFDNADHAFALDYEEVTVSRRLYRSGESEYMINGQNVRLKDVQELFFDTGIGKEGYSIIGQGQIEAIVSGRPEERRGLFDEACGIVKYKKRKQAAEKKLESQEADLTRITDILKELERRVGPLEKQSASAREYLKLRESLKLYEVNLFLRESEQLLKNIGELENNISIAEGSLEDARLEADKLKEYNSKLSDEIENAEACINRGKEEKLKGELLIQNLESQITVLETEITAERSNRVLFGESIEKIRKAADERNEAILSYLSSAADLKQDLSIIEGRADELKNEKDLPSVSELRERLEGFESELLSFLPEELKNQAKIPGTAAEAEAGDDDENEFEFEEPEWLKAIKAKRNDLSVILEKEERTREWVNKASAEYNDLTLRLRELNGNKNTVNERYMSSFSKLETLRNIAERYEGYGQSVQSVMKLKERNKGINGVVADIITTKPQYETAVETALGSRIQNIVTDNERTAKGLIEHLKRNKLGRATFLPLDAVRARVQEEYRKAVNEPGCIGLASDIVTSGEEYEDLVISLLGNTLVCDNIDNALSIAGKYRHGLRIVTLEGELLSPGGAISGGSFRNSSNLMGRAREIGELKEKTDKLKAELSACNQSIRDCEKEIEDKDTELAQLQSELRSITDEKNSLSFGLISEMKMKLQSVNQSADYIAENIERVSIEIRNSGNEIKALEDKITDSIRIENEKNSVISERKEDIVRVREGVSESRKTSEEAEKKREQLMRTQKDYFERRDSISGEILELEKELLRLNNSLEKTNQKAEESADYMRCEYELTPAAAVKYRDDTLGSDSFLKSGIASVKGSIKALGPINIQAIEEYKEVAERYELMKVQHEDITKSRAEIVSIIDELNAGMKKQFAEKFEEIRTEFSSVFKELFGGGHADLELIFDEEEGCSDELSAGIGINAQPPGKKLQNMMQLSGGEKALTAIALLFAIQNLKPSPFCLLDEIEAALDDSNVIRFARYIKRLTDTTQFILITHRRGTMEAADRLYGITMQEKGVTSLVSVDLVSDSVS